MQYDAIVVGGGPIGAHVAKKLGEAKKRVLVLEAGRAGGLTWEGYRTYVDTFYTQLVKDTNSPYPMNASAPFPHETDLARITPGTPDLTGYQVQNGPQAFASTYLRQLGGTSLHWLGTVPRFVPNDFHMRTKYGVGVDWPLTYAELEPYYREAEWSMGVSANKRDQEMHGVWFPDDYDYPMERIPPSYSDQILDRATDGLTVEFAGQAYPVEVSSLAQARNSIPRDGYKPVGAVGNPEMGLRCEGNSACIPICPVQAKYSSLKTIAQCDPEYVTVVCQAVVSKLHIGPHGRITDVEYIQYETEGGEFKTAKATATIVVLAGHAIENAKLLLASGAANSSDQVGRNLMDHPFSYSWALAPKTMGSFRGPLQTSGIETLRDGDFRKHFAAFRVDLSNVGWDIATYPPDSNVNDALRPGHTILGKKLRAKLSNELPRQVRLGYDLEQLPEARNRVTISREYVDAIGCFRPVIDYDLSDYTWQAMVESEKLSHAVYDRLQIPKHDRHFVMKDADAIPDEEKYRAPDGKDYKLNFIGAGHHVGTHRMGVTRYESVVNRDQRSWDHENLFICGCGSFPTIGTANPTLTAVALTLRSVPAMLRQLA